jgi:uracil-DNA glycosylase family 4
LTSAERRAALDAVAAEVAACKRCRLHEGRTKAVPGEGNADTEVVFVGEGPGFHEDRLGRPFVGQAGALLDKLLASVYWKRDEVFIANVVKCRPPDNRDPEPEEIAACAPYLIRQLEILDPALVVTLGRFSMARFNPGAKISQVHGTFKPAHPDSGAPRATAFFMYHPAAALRSSQVEAQCYADMKGVPDALAAARTLRAAGPSDTEAAASPGTAADTAPVEAAEPAEPEAEEAAQSDPTSQLSLF